MKFLQENFVWQQLGWLQMIRRRAGAGRQDSAILLNFLKLNWNCSQEVDNEDIAEQSSENVGVGRVKWRYYAIKKSHSDKRIKSVFQLYLDKDRGIIGVVFSFDYFSFIVSFQFSHNFTSSNSTFWEREPEIPHHRGIIQLDTKENQIEKFHLFIPGEL